MLNELAEMINKKFNLEGKELEAACLVVGAALGDTMAIMKASGKMDKNRMNQADCYTIANHFQTRLNNIRKNA